MGLAPGVLCSCSAATPATNGTAWLVPVRSLRQECERGAASQGSRGAALAVAACVSAALASRASWPALLYPPPSHNPAHSTKQGSLLRGVAGASG